MNPKYSFDSVSFGTRLRKIREFYGMTQDFVAEYVGVSVKSVQNWEKGEKMPGIDHVILLGQCFNMTVGEILEDEAYRVFKKKADARKRTIEIIEIPNRIEMFFEFAEDRFYDRYEAWIWDDYAKYKYLYMSIEKLVSYEEFKLSVLEQADQAVGEYRKFLFSIMTDSDIEVINAIKNKMLYEMAGKAKKGAMHVVDTVYYSLDEEG